jgi:hypothetical protein
MCLICKAVSYSWDLCLIAAGFGAMTQQELQQQQQHQGQHLAECLQLSKSSPGRQELIESGELQALCELANEVLPAG